MARRILVVGGGFAGLWSAAAAARALDAARVGRGAVEIALVNPDPFHVIRVRCYEAALDPVRVPLDEVLGPIGVRRIEGTVTGLDAARRIASVQDATGTAAELPWDRLVLAAGSALWRPPLPGLAEHGFDVDTHAGALRLRQHLAGLAASPEGEAEGSWTAVVIGAGLVGIEIACELPL
ncbi:MAG TPA: FAD-dependent oxidoreductase, partial [Crenalkalicoccus sp.]|nr:FAD-dependent oxidoreductase [Crenalkalicoccus sp.]